MKHVTHSINCTGCSACQSICPKHSITMKEDDEGFLYPAVDEKTCIDCGLCEKTCHARCVSSPRLPLQAYAMENKDEEIHRASSSGGVFYLLAQEIISQGGIVVGASFDEEWQVKHKCIECIEELPSLMRSKYVQSHTGGIHEIVRKHLVANRKVLFCGTPCLVSSIHYYMTCKKVDCANLFLVDFICHGVPSPGVWRWYLNNIANPKDICSVNFRDKTKGHNNYHFTLKSKKEISEPHDRNKFMRVFLNNLCLRPSCHDCTTKEGRSHSDITLADFWHVEKLLPAWNSNAGTSLVLECSPKGQGLLRAVAHKLRSEQVGATDALIYNPSWNHSSPRHPSRRRFYKYYKLHPKDFDRFVDGNPVTLFDKLFWWISKI